MVSPFVTNGETTAIETAATFTTARGLQMNACEAFLNDAGEKNLELLNTLLASSSTSTERDADERQAEEESDRDTASQPGGFKNDPDDATNPNEVREHHLKKVKTISES